MFNKLFFVLCLVIGDSSHLVYGIRDTHEEDLELEKQLNLLNKPPVKSIHTEFGYIVDCININKQPAFDHPLLKNHKLQRKPSVQNSFRKTKLKNSRAESIFGFHKVQCPTGTVPIRRVTKEEVYLVRECGPFYGATGSTSVYKPRLNRKDQSTSSHLRIQNGPVQAADELTFGWHVAPQLYGGDEGPHVFAFWGNILKKTGCCNILCPGFVQTHKGFYLGGRLKNISIYGGPMFESDISIFQDIKTKNWWISIQHQNIGYFPATLFSNMTSADFVGWGGATITPPGTPSPQMGSGYFPDGELDHASYFKQVAFQNESRQSYIPPDYCGVNFNDKPDCFKAAYHSDESQEITSLEFGGPDERRSVHEISGKACPGALVLAFIKWDGAGATITPSDIPSPQMGFGYQWKFPKAFSVDKRLEIDYAPALVGFEFKNGRSYPVFDGIVRYQVVSCRNNEESSATVCDSNGKNQNQRHQQLNKCDANLDASLMLAGVCSHLAYGIRNTHEKDLELETQLKLVNKPPVKSIHTEFGYIVDCIDINKQPAFDHPLLKNHKLQVSTFAFRFCWNAEPWIALRGLLARQGDADLRMTFKKSFGSGAEQRVTLENSLDLAGLPNRGWHLFLRSLSAQLGCRAKNSTCIYQAERSRKPSVNSFRNINVKSSRAESEFGLHKVQCSAGTVPIRRITKEGFVQTHQEIYLGGRLKSISIYGGVTFESEFSIFQDIKTKNWWIGIEGQNIGYFPATLFSNMTSADFVGWGGKTITPPGTPSPQMGSGYFPDGDHASYFKHVGFQNESRQSYTPPDYCAVNFNDKPDCFKAAYHSDDASQDITSLEFGGPGGSCGD
ncbi:hypothetical protein Fmac_031149 [Flemingia macrophylla]|uniref:Neprosin PEP catalytic domain-containing protein n=1 Tax=Flemingia macrophylla TaxID=520843 RepID=A0ABD1L1P7_9FABA